MGDGWLQEKHLCIPDVMQKICDFHCKRGNWVMRQSPCQQYTQFQFYCLCLMLCKCLHIMNFTWILQTQIREKWQVVSVYTRTARSCSICKITVNIQGMKHAFQFYRVRLWYACTWRKRIHSYAEFQVFKVGIYLISKQKLYFSNNVAPYMYENSMLWLSVMVARFTVCREDRKFTA